MNGPSTAVRVVVLALAVTAGVFVILRAHHDSGQRVSVAPNRTGVSTPTAQDHLAKRRLAENDEKISGDQPEEAQADDQTPEKAGDGRVPWPTNIENLIWEYFAHRGKSNITSIISVECTPTDCEIVFTGTEINPRVVDTFSDLHDDMYSQPWGVRQSGIGTVELAPGVRAYVIGISNIPFDESLRAPAEPEETPASPDE
jgi:hypothetical protein